MAKELRSRPAAQAPAADRSGNPYRRFYTRDRSARDLVRPPQEVRKEPMEKCKDTRYLDFRHALNFELLESREGYVKLEMEVLEAYVNRIGSLHGGLLYTLADSACGAAVLTYGNKATTLNGSIDYLKPGIGCKTIYAEARVIKHGHHVSATECEIRTEKGELLCTAHMSFFDLGVKADYSPIEKYQRA